jgi:hypothetical protein
VSRHYERRADGRLLNPLEHISWDEWVTKSDTNRPEAPPSGGFVAYVRRPGENWACVSMQPQPTPALAAGDVRVWEYTANHSGDISEFEAVVAPVGASPERGTPVEEILAGAGEDDDPDERPRPAPGGKGGPYWPQTIIKGERVPLAVVKGRLAHCATCADFSPYDRHCTRAGRGADGLCEGHGGGCPLGKF